jgi:hypothetical protein
LRIAAGISDGDRKLGSSGLIRKASGFAAADRRFRSSHE